MSYSNYNNSFRRNKIVEPSQLKSAYNIFTPTATQKFMLGAILEMNDGRKFRYCKDNGSGLTKALMACSEPLDAQADESVQTAYGVTAGEVKFDVLCETGNGYTDHELIDGYMLVNKGTCIGDMYIIKDNYWITSDTVMMIEIADENGIRTTIPATDEITLVKNKCRDTKVNPTTQDAPVVGVPLATVTASYYYWAQYKGTCPLMVDAGDTVVVGEPIGKAGTAGTAGAGGVVGTTGANAVWGTVRYVATGGETALVDLNLPE